MSQGLYYTSIDTTKLSVGSYQLQTSVVADGEEFKSVKNHVFVSYPLFVTWTMDWEGEDVPDDELVNLAEFSSKYDLPVTQLFNPSIYLSSDIPASRAEYLTEWILNRSEVGDEIGMHLHMHHYLVEAAEVEVRTSPKWTNYLNNGHDVPMTAYTEEEITQIIKYAGNLFLENGLPGPLSFRAGGWFANLETLHALEANGFVIDTSGRESYVWGANRIKGYWSLSSTTHPYKPSTTNQNSSTPGPNFVIWEFPNNGADSWFNKADTLIGRFIDNYKQLPLERSQTVTYLSHPHQIHKDIEVLTPTFDHIDQFLITNDQGPVMYVTLLDAYKLM
jgi:hypothetical protein